MDGSSKFAALGFSLSSTDDDIKSEHIENVEFILISFLVEGFLVNYNIISVDQELLQVVREHSLNGVAFIGFNCLSDKSCNIGVLISRFQ